jgi:hypothetical protein
MEYINLNLTEMNPNSVGNPFSLTDLALGTESQGSPQRGGFLWSSNGASKMDKSILNAAKLKKYEVVKFMLDEGLVTNPGAADENGNTLLHILVMDGANNEAVEIVKKLLLCPQNVKSYINKQNKKYKQTPLHIAASNGYNEVAELLEKAGADRSIKDANGSTVETETEAGKEEKPTGTEAEMSRGGITDQVRSIIDKFFPKRATVPQPADMNTETGPMVPLETEQRQSTLASDLARKYAGQEQQQGGTVDTEHFLNSLIDKYLKQDGGNSIQGSRTPNRYSADSRRSHDLSRLIGGQEQQSHRDVLNDIRKALGVDPENPDATPELDERARNIKAFFWSLVKKDNPNASNLEKTAALVKLVTKKAIDKITDQDVEEGKAARGESRTRSEERRKQRGETPQGEEEKKPAKKAKKASKKKEETASARRRRSSGKRRARRHRGGSPSSVSATSPYNPSYAGDMGTSEGDDEEEDFE